MKCPKCGYISFDFNQVCPKCNKDIAVEQAKLHIASFRPEAPALLGALIGEADDSSAGVVGASTGLDSGEVGFEDSGDVDSGEVGFGDSGDLDMSLAEDNLSEEAVSAFDSAELEPSAGELEIASEESVTDFELEGDERTLSMDSGEFPSGESGEEGAVSLEPEPEEGGLAIDLDDLSLDEPNLTEAAEIEEPLSEAGAANIDLESLASELEEAPVPQEAEPPAEEEIALDLDAEPAAGEEVTLDLDDLKIDESGELQVDTAAEALEEVKKDLEAGDLSLEEAPSEGEIPMEMEDESEDMDIDLDALSADLEGTSGTPGEGGDLSLDLDDLELELDLDKPEPKSS